MSVSRALAVLTLLLPLACAIRVEDNAGLESESLTYPAEYEDYFYSSDGFDMVRSEAHSLALKEAKELDACGVTIPYLKNLKRVLYSSDGFDMSRSELKSIMLLFAKLHVDPNILLKTYKGLYNTDGLDMTKTDARTMAISLLRKDVSPIDEIVAIQKFLYSRDGADLSKSNARALAIEAGEAGCEASFFVEAYKKSRDFKWALDEAVPKSVAGLAMRYASDGIAYTAAQFQSYYKDSWVTEWQKSPAVMKLGNRDSQAYTAAQFKAYFGDWKPSEMKEYFGAESWEQLWREAKVATQMRIADDGVAYSLDAFAKYYGDGWQQKWVTAPQALCRECRTW